VQGNTLSRIKSLLGAPEPVLEGRVKCNLFDLKRGICFEEGGGPNVGVHSARGGQEC
jgi:hypothetical protein